MRLFYGQFMAIVFGIAGSPSTAVNNYDGYIGCYEYEKGTKFNTTNIQKKSGSACKEHCFPRYRYAGIQLNECYCGDSEIGIKVAENLCVFPCGDFMETETCGGSFKLTMYEVMEIDKLTTTNNPTISATSTTTTKPTTAGVMNDSISTNSTEDVPWSNNIIWYISIPVVFVISVGFILVIRCIYKRKPTRTQVSQAMANDSYNESDVIAVTNRPATDLGHRGQEAEASTYDTTSTSSKSKSLPNNRMNFDKSWKVKYCTRNVGTNCNCNSKDAYNTLQY